MTKGGKKNTQKRRSVKKRQNGGGFFDFLKSPPKPVDANDAEKKNTGFFSSLFGSKKPQETPQETQNPLTESDETDKNPVEPEAKGPEAVEAPKIGGKRKNKTAKKPRKK